MEHRTQPDKCFEIGCPLAGKSRGFCLGNGDPQRAKVTVVLERPGQNELSWRNEPPEIELRERDYPDLPKRFIQTGAPAVGASGSMIDNWTLGAVGIHRRDVFMDNVLRCGESDNSYPTGDIRKKAEACCRVWDRFQSPSVFVISIHPALILRETTALPLQIADFRKALDFARAGERPVVLAGGKASEWFLGRSGINVLRLRGSYEFNTAELVALRERRRAEGMLLSGQGKVRKGRKGVKNASKDGMDGPVSARP